MVLPQNQTKLRPVERVFFLAVVAGSVSVLAQGLARLAQPHQLNYVEGIILNAAAALQRGEPLYPPPGDSPFIFNQYGPVLYYLVAALLEHFGLSFAPARLLVLLASLAVAGLLSLLLWRWTGSRLLALSFGFLFLILPVGRAWSVLLRPDLLGIALALTGLCVFALLPRLWYWSVPLFAAALAIKFSLIAAPGACLLLLLGRKAWKPAAGLAVGVGVLLGGVFLYAQHTGGGGGVFHLIGTHVAPFYWPRFAMHFSAYLLIHSPLLLLASPLLGSNSPGRSLALLYLGLAALVGVGIGRGGFDLNHLLELSAALCLCAGLGYAEARQQSRLPSAAALGLGLTLVLAVGSASVGFRPSQDRIQCPQLYDFVASHPGQHILSEEIGVLVLAGKPVFLNDPYLYTRMVEQAGWSPEPLNRRVRQRYFDAIILGDDLDALRTRGRPQVSLLRGWPAGFLDAVNENYRVTRRFTCTDATVVYEPAAALPATSH